MHVSLQEDKYVYAPILYILVCRVTLESPWTRIAQSSHVVAVDECTK